MARIEQDNIAMYFGRKSSRGFRRQSESACQRERNTRILQHCLRPANPIRHLFQKFRTLFGSGMKCDYAALIRRLKDFKQFDVQASMLAGQKSRMPRGSNSAVNTDDRDKQTKHDTLRRTMDAPWR